MRVLIFAVLGSWAALASAAGKPATMLEPMIQWLVDYADDNCRLIRTFGTDKNAVKLVFEQAAPRSPITVMLVGRLGPRTDNNILSFEPLAAVRLGGGQNLVTVKSHDRVVFWPRRLGRGRWGLIPDALDAQTRKANPVLAQTSPSAPWDEKAPPIKWTDHDWSVEPEEQWQAEDAAFGARADQVTSIVFNRGRYKSVSLHSGAMGKPLQALEQCASESLKDWGVDPAVQSTIVTGAYPVTDPVKLFTSDDYPKAALQASQEDNFEVWLNIDAQGGIAGCRPISDFAAPAINDAICAMIRQKERFVPARTKDGASVADFYIQSFVFKVG
jgi:hypothetical protein